MYSIHSRKKKRPFPSSKQETHHIRWTAFSFGLDRGCKRPLKSPNKETDSWSSRWTSAEETSHIYINVTESDANLLHPGLKQWTSHFPALSPNIYCFQPLPLFPSRCFCLPRLGKSEVSFMRGQSKASEQTLTPVLHSVMVMTTAEKLAFQSFSQTTRIHPGKAAKPHPP